MFRLPVQLTAQHCPQLLTAPKKINLMTDEGSGAFRILLRSILFFKRVFALRGDRGKSFNLSQALRASLEGQFSKHGPPMCLYIGVYSH